MIAEPTEVVALPTSLAQERFWRLDRMNPGNPTWSVPVRFRLQGVLKTELVERAFNEIVRRHEVLRTTFALIDEKPVQVIKPSLDIEVPVTDLRHLPKPERDAEVDRLSFEAARWRFDLGVGPLFRVGLLRTDDNEHVLLVTPHHTVADYWSIGLISNELGALYEAYERGVDPILPQLTIQYGDFAVWQHEQLQSSIVRDELTYWKKQLDKIPLLDFPTDRPRPSFPTYDATITSILLPVELTDAIRNIANREGITFFNTMLAAYALLLWKYTGQTDFGIATQVAGRNSVELEPLIGVFVNNVVLRMDLSGDPSFPELVRRVQEVGLQSLAHQNVRFEQLLAELRPNDYPSHHTLFRANFICQRDPVKPLEFSGIKLTVIPSKCQGALYDVNVFLVLRNEGWRLACEYNTGLYDSSTITRLLDNYRKLLQSIAEDPNLRLSQFPRPEGLAPVRTGDRRAEVVANSLLVATEASCAPASDHQESATRDNSNAEIASRSSDSSPKKAPTPIAEAYAMPAGIVQRRFWMLEEITPGNPALHMRACVRVTGPLSVRTLEESLQTLVTRHETLRTTFEKLNDKLVQVVSPSQVIRVGVTSLEHVPAAQREAELKKAIRSEVSAPFDLSRGPLLRARLFRLQLNEYVLVLTTHHIVVDGWSQRVIQSDLWTIYEALSSGRELPMLPLSIHYGDFACWQAEWLTSDGARAELEFWQKQLAPPLPVLNLGTERPREKVGNSEPMETLLLPDDLVKSLKSLSQSQDVSMFMVMLTAYSALLHCYTKQDDILIGSPVANRKPETELLIGPFAGMIPLRLRGSGNPAMRELLGRVRDTALEALSHADLPFEFILEALETRSLRGRNPFQNYFFYQTAFLEPRQLRDLVVTPLPDFGLGTHFELQMGLLERREGLRAQLEYDPDLFQPADIRKILEDYKNVLEAMAENNDVRLTELPVSPFSQSESAPAPRIAVGIRRPKDEIEKRLMKIWEDLLGIGPIGVNQNYFDLGGNSLLATRLFARIKQAFNVDLPLSTLIEAQTIEDLARILRGEDETPGWSPLVPIQIGGSLPPFFCVHGGGGNVLIYRDLSRRLGPDQPFYGLQSQGLDGRQPLLTRIEDMATLYLKAVRTVQPHGPYFLGGYCMGGTVAFEMAQQLEALGEKVALLALFDTTNWASLPTRKPSTRWQYQAERLCFHAANFMLLNFEDKLKFLREKLKVLRSRTRVWRGIWLNTITKAGTETKSASSLLARIWRTNDRASLTYFPRPYASSVADFRPIKQYSYYTAPCVNWHGLALGEWEVITLPVYPAGMLLEPFVKDLAASLASAIEKAAQKQRLPLHQEQKVSVT